MAKILVIDDEDSIRFTFRTFLEGEDHEVRTARNYEEAAAALEQEACDLVFADIILGARTGIDVLRRVKELGLHCPVIVITGEPSVETAAEAVRLGAFEYVSKPVNKEKLLSSARVALRQKKLEDEKRALEQEKDTLRLNLEAVFRSVPDAIVTLDDAMCIMEANQSTDDVFGVPPGQIKGLPCHEALDGNPAFCEAVAQTLRTRRPMREFRVENVRTDGVKQTLVLTCSPLQDGRNRYLGAVLIARDITRLAGLERELEERRQYQNIVGKSRPMQNIYRLLEDLSETDTTVLITGASGTGKELVAEALHYNGRRARKPLVKVNCSALSENLLESELFGHVRGAFTGAVKDKVGRFHLAHGGTIFLDEIGDISSRIQVKLLRVLQEKEFERVGDSETIKVDVRVIAATNQPLRERVARGEFREDLYYRLKVLEINLPVLRERREDIPLLTDHFIAVFNKQMGKRIVGVSDQVRSTFMGYDWPGNVRELKHAVEHAFILSRGGSLEVEDLPMEIRQPRLLVAEAGARYGSLRREHVQQALAQSGGNKAKAARLLGVSRQTIYRKLKEYNLG
jgi:PAS domain S-box-containing protein